MTTVTRPGWGPTSTKTVTWHEPLTTAAAVAELSGLEFLRAVGAGELPPPPIASLFGMRGVEADEGRVVFAVTPDASSYNPIGVVHGGLVCTLLDTVLGCAAHSTLPKGTGYTSLEIKVNYLRPVTTASGELRATGRVVRPGRRACFTEGEVLDTSGKTVATAASTILVFPLA